LQWGENMTVTYILFALLAGSGLPVQGAANARLSKALASPFAATTLQLAIGASLLFVAAAGSGDVRALGKFASIEWWRLSAGLASAAYVVAGIILFPRIGAVVTVGLFIAGQVFASLLLDAVGPFGVTRRAFTLLTWVGAALAVAGILLIVRGQRHAGGAVHPGWIALGMLCGGLLPLQGAINASLVKQVDAPLAVALTSFVVATLAMGLVSLVSLRSGARPQLAGLRAMPWWGWLGGLVGACYVTTVFSAMPVIGAAATVGFTIAGQQLVSVLMDRFGLLGLPRNAVSTLRICGIAALLAGVLCIKLG
jgi:transporter family-2 protein